GAQLATRWLTKNEIDDLNDTDKAHEVAVEKAPDLLHALDRQAATDERTRESRSTRGRFWLSDGKPFGVRQIAIFAPPAFNRALDECCDDEVLLDTDDCCDDAPRPEVIKSPVALAFGQTVGLVLLNLFRHFSPTMCKIEEQIRKD